MIFSSLRAFAFSLTLLPAVFCSVSAVADSLDIYPAVKADSPVVAADVASILNVIDVFRGDGRALSGLNFQIESVNFYFVSGEGTIVDQRVTVEALAPLGSDFANEMAELSTNSDTCFVQSVLMGNGMRATIVAHEEDHDNRDDVYTCLLAGLWWVAYGSFDGFDVDNWRGDFTHLLNDVDG